MMEGEITRKKQINKKQIITNDYWVLLICLALSYTPYMFYSQKASEIDTIIISIYKWGD